MKPVLGDVHSIPFDDDSMDLVVSRGSVFFWSDRTRAFSECRRVLRPGGKAYIGGGFGSADLRNDICPRMLERDPDWDEKRRGWVGRCDIDSIHEGLLGARIVEFDVARDDSGFWIRFVAVTTSRVTLALISSIESPGICMFMLRLRQKSL